MKYCPRCTKYQRGDAFHKDSSKKDGLNMWCIECHKKARKARESTPEGRQTKAMKQRIYTLARNYGITVEEYEQKFAEQNGLCAICDQPQPERLLAVDHDHITGQVRGLLCSKCNLMIGNAGEYGDNTWVLQQGITYLLAWREVPK